MSVTAVSREPGCVCGHMWEVHAIGVRSGAKVRTRCSHGAGPRGDRCPCVIYTHPREDRS